MSLTLSTNGIFTTINPTIPAHMIPSTQFRGLNPNILLESSTLSGIPYSYSLSSFTVLSSLIYFYIYYIVIYINPKAVFFQGFSNKKGPCRYCSLYQQRLFVNRYLQQHRRLLCPLRPVQVTDHSLSRNHGPFLLLLKHPENNPQEVT